PGHRAPGPSAGGARTPSGCRFSPPPGALQGEGTERASCPPDLPPRDAPAGRPPDLPPRAAPAFQFIPGRLDRFYPLPLVAEGEATHPPPVSEGLAVRVAFLPTRRALFVVLSAADLGLTWWLLERSGGAYEANPLARWWLLRCGWLGLAALEAGQVMLVLG